MNLSVKGKYALQAIFDLAGQLLMSFGVPGQGAGQFNLPAGLWLDDVGRVFVADTYNHRIQVFQLLSAGDGGARQ